MSSQKSINSYTELFTKKFVAKLVVIGTIMMLFTLYIDGWIHTNPFGKVKFRILGANLKISENTIFCKLVANETKTFSFYIENIGTCDVKINFSWYPNETSIVMTNINKNPIPIGEKAYVQAEARLLQGNSSEIRLVVNGRKA